MERRAWEAPESLKTYRFLYIFIISWVERRAWDAPESLKTYGFLHFHYFFGGTESVGRPGIIENIWISMHFLYFFYGAEIVESSRII